jgi:hypothetical protein
MPIWQLRNYADWTVVYAVLSGMAVALIAVSVGLTAVRCNALLLTAKRSRFHQLQQTIRAHANLKARWEHQPPNAVAEWAADKVTLEILERHSKDVEELPLWPTDAASLNRLTKLAIALLTPLIVGLLRAFGFIEALQKALPGVNP